MIPVRVPCSPVSSYHLHVLLVCCADTHVLYAHTLLAGGGADFYAVLPIFFAVYTTYAIFGLNTLFVGLSLITTAIILGECCCPDRSHEFASSTVRAVQVWSGQLDTPSRRTAATSSRG